MIRVLNENYIDVDSLREARDMIYDLSKLMQKNSVFDNVEGINDFWQSLSYINRNIEAEIDRVSSQQNNVEEDYKNYPYKYTSDDIIDLLNKGSFPPHDNMSIPNNIYSETPCFIEDYSIDDDPMEWATFEGGNVVVDYGDSVVKINLYDDVEMSMWYIVYDEYDNYDYETIK